MSEVLPQPWDFEEGETRASHLLEALQRQADGERLVRETYVNAYETDPNQWVIDYVVVTDWDTGEQLLTRSPMDEFEPPSYEGLFVVERVLEND